MIFPDPGFGWLKDAAFNDYSQFGEDGVLKAIFNVIKPANEWCFECGASDGLFFSNTRRLIERGWNGILVEADDGEFVRLVENCKAFEGRVKCVHETASRLDDILSANGAPQDIDLVVIDVDGQDYHLFNSMLTHRPRVVMIEFDWKAEARFAPSIKGHGQAGQEAIYRLARGRFYELVFVSPCNAIFVHQSMARKLLK